MAPELPLFSSASAFARTQPPNPQWNLGQGVGHSALGKTWEDSEAGGWKVVDADTEDRGYLYSLMISGVIPRPIAFVSTLADNGTANLAPFSWFNMVTHHPPTISISTSHVSGQEKDTLRNIKATKTFTVNIISEPWVEQANFCSLDAPPNVSEWPASGLTKEPSTLIDPPRVKESAFSMECELFHAHDVCPAGATTPTATLILGLVKLIHVRRDVLNERGTVDPDKFRVISRLGGLTYGRVGAGFDLPRPRWAQVHEAVSAASREESPMQSAP